MCMRAIELPTAPYGVCIDTEAQWRIWAWILHASPPLHGFLGLKRKPCLHDQSPIYRSMQDCKSESFHGYIVSI